MQAEPVIFDREAMLDRLETLTADAASEGAEPVVFPETFVSVYPSSSWARALAVWDDPAAGEAFVNLAESGVEVPGPAVERLGAVAREHAVWLVTGVNELDPQRNGTVYNALLCHAPDGSLALRHRELVPTNHERLVWGQGDGSGLRALETPLGRIGRLICFEDYMPLARFALYESRVEVYLAPTADESDEWQATLVHIARESRAYVVSPCHLQRAAAYPPDFPLREPPRRSRPDRSGRERDPRSDGSYLAGPLYGEEGILYAEFEGSCCVASVSASTTPATTTAPASSG